MRVYEGSQSVAAEHRGCVLTLGNFDGLHVGHRALLDAVLSRARELGKPAALYTFDPHPRRVLSPDTAQPQLMQWEQLTWELSRLGIDSVIRERFTRDFASLEPEQFLRDVLVECIAPVELFVGRDFHFGRGRAGSGEMLSKLGPDLGFRVHVIPQVRMAGVDVSSTRIREDIASGEVASAARALGRPYEIWGRIVSGDRRGRELGFPTANLDSANELIPANGVYATRARLFSKGVPGDEVWPAVTNVGTRPTFEPGRVLVETHLIDGTADLYGQQMAVAFCDRIRPERRFSGADELKEQIARDVVHARDLLGSPVT